MRSAQRGVALAGIMVAVILWAAPPALADDTALSYTEGAFRKLGRGLANVVSSPAELLRRPELVGRQDGYVAGMTAGIFQGIWQAVVRGLAGVVEIATFPVGFPRGDFQPILLPEFVWAHGDWADETHAPR